MEKINQFLDSIKSRFEISGKALMPGWLRDGSGLCGAELETIVEKFNNEQT